MIDRAFIITYLDVRGRLVHRACRDGRWYHLDAGVWRRLARRPRLVRRYA